MKNYKHIGWVLYCTTSTSISDPSSKKVKKPWPCQSYFGKEKPELDFQETPEQFFWEKIYASNN